VCSTTAAQLARICRAIEELAGYPGRRGGAAADPAAREGAVPGREGTVPAQEGAVPGQENAVPGQEVVSGADEHAARDLAGASPEEALARLAEIWAMIAEADPELARRVPGYLGAAD
jgi:hypothetical protein